MKQSSRLPRVWESACFYKKILTVRKTGEFSENNQYFPHPTKLERTSGFLAIPDSRTFLIRGPLSKVKHAFLDADWQARILYTLTPGSICHGDFSYSSSSRSPNLILTIPSQRIKIKLALQAWGPEFDFPQPTLKTQCHVPVTKPLGRQN